MPGGLTLLASANADIPTPAAGKVTVYFSIELNEPAFKDDSGTVHTMTGTTGAAGPSGNPGFGFDGEDSEPLNVIPGRDGGSGSVGPTGPTGDTGAQGPIGPPGISDGEVGGGDESFMFPPGTTGSQGIAGSAAWTLVAAYSPSAENIKDFTGLGAPADILVLITGMTLSATGSVIVQLSTDNGSTFLSSSGDYISINGAGTTVNNGNFIFYSPTASAARSGAMQIEGCNVAAPKICRSTFFSVDGINLQYAPTTGQINAIRVRGDGAHTMSAGTIYVYTR